MTGGSLAARHAWRGALVASLLNAGGMGLDFLLAWDRVPNMPRYPYVLSEFVALGLVVFLWMRRDRPTVVLGSVAFLVNTAAILAGLWVTNGYWAMTRAWTPFQAHKLGALAVPLVAPELRVGLLAIGGFAATAIIKFYTFDPRIQQTLPPGEPWFVLAYALFAAVLLAYRLRGLAFERDLIRANAEAAAAERFARTSLYMRDYANTPIQTIVLETELLRLEHPELRRATGRLNHAAKTLTRLSRTLDRYAAAHTWTLGDESPTDGA
jgi:hypothetical protein